MLASVRHAGLADVDGAADMLQPAAILIVELQFERS